MASSLLQSLGALAALVAFAVVVVGMIAFNASPLFRLPPAILLAGWAALVAVVAFFSPPSGRPIGLVVLAVTMAVFLLRWSPSLVAARRLVEAERAGQDGHVGKALDILRDEVARLERVPRLAPELAAARAAQQRLLERSGGAVTDALITDTDIRDAPA